MEGAVDCYTYSPSQNLSTFMENSIENNYYAH